MRRLSPLLAAFLAACSAAAPHGPPRAEFLVAAGDSTFWVTSDTGGVRMRGSPLLLARWGGRYYEVYAADDDRSYYDAVLVGQHVYRRDLLTGDSTLVFADTAVPRVAARYARAHPDERPLRPDEDGAADPSTVATAEVDLLDFHGPFLSYEYRVDVQGGGDDERHVARRGVVDLRNGVPMTVASLFGDRAAARILEEGRQAYALAVDSIRAARGPLARRAARALASFGFDPLSFTLTDLGRAPAVAFAAPGHGVQAGGIILPLAPVPAAPAPWWRADVRGALPETDGDSLADRWRGPGYEVIARYDSADDGLTLAIRDSARHEWVAGKLPAPARQLWFLDAPPIDATVRRGLARAFDAAALYSEDARTAMRLDRRRGPRARLAGGRASRAPHHSHVIS